MYFQPDWVGLRPFHSRFSGYLYLQSSDTYCCEYCNRTFATVAAYEQHVRNSAAHSIICDLCNIRYKTLSSWQDHVRAMHAGPYLCCGREFAQIEHFCQHHFNTDCHQLVRYWTRNGRFDHLNQHESSFDDEHGGETYFCDDCPARFRSLANLGKHLRAKEAGQIRLRHNSSQYLEDPDLLGHGQRPYFFYRVQYSGSLTMPDSDNDSLRSRGRYDPHHTSDGFINHVADHCNWISTASPFISVFTNKSHAVDWARRMGRPNMRLMVISPKVLLDRGIRMWKVDRLIDSHNMQVKRSEWHHDEWLCLHDIPDEAVRWVEVIDTALPEPVHQEETETEAYVGFVGSSMDVGVVA